MLKAVLSKYTYSVRNTCFYVVEYNKYMLPR